MHSSDSPAQHLISEDGFPYPRGRILGGSSAIDAGFYSSADPSLHFDSDLSAGRSYTRFVVNSTELPSQDYDRSVFRPELSNWQPAASDAYCGLTLDRRVGTEMGGSAFDGAAERIQLVGIVPLEHSVVQFFGITKAGAYLAAASDVIPFSTPASSVFIKRTPSPPLHITNSLPHSYRVSGGVPHGKSHVMTREGFLSTFTEVHTFGSPALHHISEDGLPNARGTTICNVELYSRQLAMTQNVQHSTSVVFDFEEDDVVDGCGGGGGDGGCGHAVAVGGGIREDNGEDRVEEEGELRLHWQWRRLPLSRVDGGPSRTMARTRGYSPQPPRSKTRDDDGFLVHAQLQTSASSIAAMAPIRR
ncbi:hypothetical protein Tsubulata_048046 [Turnera subulata]|uniref:Uncharacterized protein n=1 Tax=Turnera subulata TaxID=218843 RepID=A0A9Q0F2A4_9ROSI|nr:hypothetical protein Tsubulata_048046 [Turnera subulata]